MYELYDRLGIMPVLTDEGFYYATGIFQLALAA